MSIEHLQCARRNKTDFAHRTRQSHLLVMTTTSDPLPTAVGDLIFPSASHNFSKTLSSIKQSTLSIHNRLNSIFQDSLFVQAVADAYQLPLVANERCGSWYIPPEKKCNSAYFKSTDGHQGQWNFSMRRLNLQVLGVIEQYHG